MARTHSHTKANDVVVPQFDTLEPRLLLSIGDAPYIGNIFGAGPNPAQEAQAVYGSGDLAEATDVPTTVGVSWGNGATDTTTIPAGQTGFYFSYAYPDDTPSGTYSDTYTVTFTTSNVYGSSSASTQLTVENVIPTITSISTDRNTINEGDSVVLSGTFTDPSALDSFDLYIDWDNGGSSDSEHVLLPAGSTSFSRTHTYANESPNGAYSIYVDLHDDDGGDCVEDGWSVTVNDVAPAITSLTLAESTVDYKTPVQVSVTFSDPGVLDEHFVRINWGDGSADTTLVPAVGQRSFSRTHGYAAPATASETYTINVTVQGYDHANDAYVTDSDSIQVTVENHDPKITGLSISPTSIDENGSTTVSGTFTDYTPNDTHSVQINWGDGSAVQTVALAADARTFSVAHTYLDDNPTGTPSDVNTVSVAVIDANGNQDDGTVDVTVSNVMPADTALTLDPAIIDEDGTTTLTGSFTDPGTLDTYTVSILWGDGSAVETISLAAGERSFSVMHQYLDDDPTGTPQDDYTIDVTVTDDDTGEDMNATVITVLNVDPVVVDFATSAPGVGDADEGETITISGSFTDVGTLDTHTAVIDWGDGTTSDAVVTQSSGSGTFEADHEYEYGGIYTVTVTVTDDDTGADTAVAYAVISGVGVHDGVLQAIGTDGNDRVKINKTGNGRIKVHTNFISDRGKKRSFDADDIEKIQILLGDGRDRAQISGNVDLLTVMDGGAGRDHMKAGRGSAVMMGAEGNDKLIGGKGDDILIGGAGKDRLVGGPGDDILIGAATVFDTDDDAVTADFDEPLLAILDEWTSDRDYDTRVENLTGEGTGDRLNEDYFLDDTTVLDGQVGDKVTGASGENWYVDIVSKNGKRKGTATRKNVPAVTAASNKGQGQADPDAPIDPDVPGNGKGNGNGKAKGKK